MDYSSEKLSAAIAPRKTGPDGELGPAKDCAPAELDDYTAQRSSGSNRSILIKIIEGEIIPRLFVAHCDMSPLQPRCEDATQQSSDSEPLIDLFMCGDRSAIVGHIDGLMARGVRREKIFLDFLAPVPRTLSLLWSEGRCSFDAMAAGLSCVDQVLQEISAREQ